MNGSGRIGLFGGSFDPIHTGHLILANAALDYASLERVFFIPTASPPHKVPGGLTPFDMRREMVELAIGDNDRFELSLIEQKEDTSYTFETVMHYHDLGYTREQLHLLIGADSMEDISRWRNPSMIFRNSTIVMMERPGYEAAGAVPPDASVIIVSTGSNTISSSSIREMISSGRSIRYLVPRAVEAYIIANSLYAEER